MDKITLAATGDSIIARRISQIEDKRFRGLAEVLRQADGRATNLEITCPAPPLMPSVAYPGIPLLCEPAILDELSWYGFNLFNVANNHAADYSHIGLVDTMRELDRRGLSYAGGGLTLGAARAPAYVDTRAGRIAILGATASNTLLTMAADPNAEVGGRPGVSPLRFRTEYRLPDDELGSLSRIAAKLGLTAIADRRRAFGTVPRHSGYDGLARQEGVGDELFFLGNKFVSAAAPCVATYYHEDDVAGIERRIYEARRQADLVVMNIHCHESRGGDWNSIEPPDFLTAACHRFIDAGADVCVGHGPHRLRGIELYRGKPIFYSLGNFFFMLESIPRFPTEYYLDNGMPATATSADMHDLRTIAADGRPKGFAAAATYWETIVPLCEFGASGLSTVRLYPVELTHGTGRASAGVPRLAEGERADAILEKVAALSADFGVSVGQREGAYAEVKL